MGNCLPVQERVVVRVMNMDGKVLEYQAPIKVFQVLSEFTGHVISDSRLPGSHHLYPHTELLSDRLYHLLPFEAGSPKPVKKKKKVRFSIPEPETQEAAVSEEKERGQEKLAAAAATDQGFRIKLVITKGELRKMIENGLVSVDGSMTYAKLENKGDDQLNCSNDDLDSNDHSSRLWKPSLVSIPEGNYYI